MNPTAPSKSEEFSSCSGTVEGPGDRIIGTGDGTRPRVTLMAAASPHGTSPPRWHSQGLTCRIPPSLHLVSSLPLLCLVFTSSVAAAPPDVDVHAHPLTRRCIALLEMSI
jgi:hypothetical protein